MPPKFLRRALIVGGSLFVTYKTVRYLTKKQVLPQPEQVRPLNCPLAKKDRDACYNS